MTKRRMNIKSLTIYTMSILIVLSTLIIGISILYIGREAAQRTTFLQEKYLESTFEIYKEDFVSAMLLGDKNLLESLLIEIGQKRNVSFEVLYRDTVFKFGIIEGTSKNFKINSNNNTLGTVKISEKGQRVRSSIGREGLVLIFIQSLLLIFGFILYFQFLNRKLIYPLADLTSNLHLQNNHPMSQNSEALEEVHILNLSLQKMASEIAELAKAKALAQIASQVSHDIRSPLSALNMALHTLQQVPEDRRILIRNAVQRINDIANSLLEKSKQHDVKTTAENIPIENLMVSTLVDSLISEKRIQNIENTKIHIEADLRNSYGLFINVNGSELKRAISNLINNSIEAFRENQGSIVVSINSNRNEIFISIRDNGIGIPKHILERLGEKGVTHGKDGTSSGSGLGVYHAKTIVESYGGKFHIESTEGEGTVIQLIFPKAPVPDWFVSEIIISPTQTIVICDDDSSIHGLWNGRLSSVLHQNERIEELHFSSTEALTSWHQKSSISEFIFYLIDYEFLNSPKNGLDVIEELGIATQSILVTSRFEEPQVQDRCEKLGLRLIPKGLVSFVPIKCQIPKIKYDAILIDDDGLIHMTWNMVATDLKKSILCFENEALFLKSANSIDLNTPIYIDVNLANGVSGIVVAKGVFDLGFKNIHLATGYDADSIERPEYIKSIVGKDFPLN